MSDAHYVIDDNGQWHDVTLTKRIEKLEAENAEARKVIQQFNARLESEQELTRQRDYALGKLSRAVELLREIDGVGHIDYPGICERIRAFLSEMEDTDV